MTIILTDEIRETTKEEKEKAKLIEQILTALKAHNNLNLINKTFNMKLFKLDEIWWDLVFMSIPNLKKLALELNIKD